jgi:hypothetical protein
MLVPNVEKKNFYITSQFCELTLEVNSAFHKLITFSVFL